MVRGTPTSATPGAGVHAAVAGGVGRRSLFGAGLWAEARTESSCVEAGEEINSNLGRASRRWAGPGSQGASSGRVASLEEESRNWSRWVTGGVRP